MERMKASDYLRGDMKVMTAILDDIEYEVRRLRSRLGDLQASIDDVMVLEEQNLPTPPLVPMPVLPQEAR